MGLLLIISILMVSCKPKPFFEETFKIAGQVWDYDQHILFQPEITDTSGNYDIFLKLKINKSYPFKNLYFRHTLKDPSNNQRTDTLNINLISKSGLWNGSCDDENCEMLAPLAQKVNFSVTGRYLIELDQFTRMDTLFGLQEIGLVIKHNSSPK